MATTNRSPKSPTAPIKEAEAAVYIGMSVAWLRKCRFEGDPRQPPYIKIGKAVRYLPADLEKWRESHRVCEAA